MVMNAARFNERISFSFFLLLFCATGYIMSKANIAKGYPKAGTTRAGCTSKKLYNIRHEHL